MGLAGKAQTLSELPEMNDREQGVRAGNEFPRGDS